MRYIEDRKLYETQFSSLFVVKLKKVFTQGEEPSRQTCVSIGSPSYVDFCF